MEPCSARDVARASTELATEPRLPGPQGDLTLAPAAFSGNRAQSPMAPAGTGHPCALRWAPNDHQSVCSGVPGRVASSTPEASYSHCRPSPYGTTTLTESLTPPAVATT